VKDKEPEPPVPGRKSTPPEASSGGDGVVGAAAAVFLVSGVAFLVSGLLNLAAILAGQFMGAKGDAVPGAVYPVLHVDGWLFSLLCVLSFSLMGVLGIAAGLGFRKRMYWARSVAVSFSLMAGTSGILLAIYASLVPGLLLVAAFYLLLVYLFVSKPMEKAFPVWVSRYGRSSSQFSLLFLINATAFGSLVIGPMLPLLRFRHMAGGYVGVPLCSIGSISRSLSGNWADLLLAPIALIAVLMLVGVLVGRALCGWACPIGFLQDLGARTKAALGLGDIELSRKGHERLKLVKYAVLLFVLILAVDIGVSTVLSSDAHSDFISGMTGFPLFQSGATPCEACPAPITGYFFPDDLLKHGVAGTFVMTPEGALRIFVLLGFVIGAFMMPRFFCRYFCPAGAMASLFNRASALSIEKEQEKCTECNYCVTACPMRVHKLKDEHVDSRVHDMECTFCLECIDSCPERALSLSFQGRTIYRGGKEWWLRTLKEAEGAGSRQPGAGNRGGERSPPPGPGPTAPGPRNPGAALFVLLLVATAFVPLLNMPVAFAVKYDDVNFPPKDAAGNYSLGSRDSWTFSGVQATINGSVILNEEASVIIEAGSKVTINGNLWLAGNSHLKVDNSTFVINIPEHPPITIEKLYLAPNGFVDVEDGASMELSSSKVTFARLKEPLMQGIVQPGYGSSGINYTYTISYTDSADRPLGHLNVVIDGVAFNMSKQDINDTTTRDGMVYAISTQISPGNHTYHFEGAGPDGPLRYPAAGEIPGPHVDTDEPRLLFGVEYLVNFGTIEATNTIINMGGSVYTHMSSRFILTGSSIDTAVVMEINSFCLFRQSNIETITAKERTGRENVLLYDCTVTTLVAESFSAILLERCTITTLDLQSNSVTTVIQSTVRFFNSGGNASANLDNSVIEAEEFPYMRMLGNSQARAYNNTTMGLVHLDETARLYLTRATVGELIAHGDTRIETEYATIGGKPELGDNATILNTLKIRAVLNGQPASVNIGVFSPNGTRLISTATREDGYRSFAVPTRVITEAGTEEIDRFYINLTYRSLAKTTELSLKNSTSELNVSLEDRDPPSIGGVQFEYFYKSLGEALVTVDVADGAGSGVSSVWVRYKVDGGKWEERPLRQIGPSRFQGSMPGLKSASKVSYEVKATDWLNNTVRTAPSEVALGVPASTMAAAALASLTILAAVGFIVILVRHRKTKRYLEGRRQGGKEM
jgi:NAD-dependent dihydropyrimidine dehydrogenase PreA subunit